MYDSSAKPFYYLYVFLFFSFFTMFIVSHSPYLAIP